MMLSMAIEDTRVRTYDRADDMLASRAEIRARLRGRPDPNGEQTLRAAFDDLPRRLQGPDGSAPPPAFPGPAPQRLDPALRLDNFVVYDGSHVPHAAMTQAAGGLGKPPIFNPIFVHANSGLGKTHLLTGAVATAQGTHQAGQALYLSAEAFLASQYRLAMRPTCRLVAIDDMQVIMRAGPRWRATLYSAIEALVTTGRQVVLASSVALADFEEDGRLQPKLRARIDAGLEMTVGPPGRDGRAAILRAQLALQPAFAAAVGEDIIAAIAAVGPANGRQLGAVLNQLHADHRYAGKVPTVERALQIVAEKAPAEMLPLRIEAIQNAVARHYGVSRNDILSSRRTANVVRPRQVAMYFAKTLTLRSLPEIGRRFGGKDHTTVLHAVRKIGELIQIDPKLAEEIAAIKEGLRAQ